MIRRDMELLEQRDLQVKLFYWVRKSLNIVTRGCNLFELDIIFKKVYTGIPIFLHLSYQNFGQSLWEGRGQRLINCLRYLYEKNAKNRSMVLAAVSIQYDF